MALTGAPTTRDHIANALEANLRKGYMSTVMNTESYFDQLFNVETTKIKIERDAVYAGYGSYPNKSEGASVTYDSGQEVWTQSYTPIAKALGVQVTYEAVEDDLHGIVRQLIKAGGNLADVAMYTVEQYCVDLFNSFLTSGTVYTVDGTNYSLVQTNNPLADGSTWSNRPTNAMDLSIEALEYLAFNHWVTNQKNQRGQLTMVPPEMLVVAPGDAALAYRLVETERGRPQSADNDNNVVRKRLRKVLCHPLLTNDGRWGLHAAKEHTGLNFFWREKPNVKKVPDGDNLNRRFMGYFRCVRGATHVNGISWAPAS